MGKRSPETVESWYSDMEQLLGGLKFSSEEMVTLAAFTLRDLAYSWWKGVLRARKGRRDPGIRWDEVSTFFHERWVGYTTRDSP